MPFVLGDAVDLHPLLVMIGSVVAFTQWGILGALLAAPVMASAKELLRYAYVKIAEPPPAPEAEPEKRSRWAGVPATLAGNRNSCLKLESAHRRQGSRP